MPSWNRARLLAAAGAAALLTACAAVGPNFTAPTAPFGKWISLDGAHPSAASHTLITNYLVDVINAKYATTLAKLPNP